MSLANRKLIVVLIFALALFGCGEKVNKESNGSSADNSSAGLLLATVGDVEIRSSYYEDRLSIMKEDELPRNEAGEPIDMQTVDGKKQFLEVLINKELLVMEANNLGYRDRPEIKRASETLIASDADKLFWADFNSKPVAEPTAEEVEANYVMQGRQRKVGFLITNYQEDAEAARAMALGGAEWADVVTKYHAGDFNPNGSMPEVNVPFNRFSADFDAMVFEPEVGGVGNYLKAGTGYWVIKVISEDIGELPDRSEAEPRIIEFLKRRKIHERQVAYRAEIDAAHKMVLNEDVLTMLFEGLPEGEVAIDPVTKKGIPRADLKPLDIDMANADLVLYSYEIAGVPTIMTLGEYKEEFDQSNSFVRPKKSGMLGGLRESIIKDIEKETIANQIRLDGWLEKPAAVDPVKIKVDQMVTMTLFKEAVVFNDQVSPLDREAFWVDHAVDYYIPAGRNGFLVVCSNQAMAEEAALLVKGGSAWDVVFDKYDTDNARKSTKGAFQVSELDDGPLKDAAFALSEAGAVSEPFAMGSGKYGVIKIEKVVPHEDDVPLAQVQKQVDSRIISKRQETAFQDFLTKLRAKYPIVVYDENLAELKGWQELKAVRTAAEGATK